MSIGSHTTHMYVQKRNIVPKTLFCIKLAYRMSLIAALMRVYKKIFVLLDSFGSRSYGKIYMICTK